MVKWWNLGSFLFQLLVTLSTTFHAFFRCSKCTCLFEHRDFWFRERDITLYSWINTSKEYSGIIIISLLILGGAWISEWYHTWLWSLVSCAMPWAVSSSRRTLSSLFYLVYLIWYYYLSVKFVMWIVKQKIENKINLFKKVLHLQHWWLNMQSVQFYYHQITIIFLLKGRI